MAITDFTLLLLVIFAIALLAQGVAKVSKLPFTLCVLLLGFAFGQFVQMSGFDTGIRAHNFADIVFFLLLPVLVFEAALNLPWQRLRKVIKTALFAATAGVGLSVLIGGAILFYAMDVPSYFTWVGAFLTAVMIAATDPVAVVAQLKSANAPTDLADLIEGESLFNDATAIVLFTLILGLAGGQSTSVGGAFIEFFRVLLGGVVVGSLLAICARWLLPLLKGAELRFVLGLTLAYGCFYIAEHVFHVSGVIATMCAAIVMQKPLMQAQDEQHQHHNWELMAYLANVVVFFLLGLVVTLEMFSSHWLAMLFGVLAAVTARAIACTLSVFVGRALFKEPISWRFAPVMVWGGLRGVVTIALVLSLPVELPYWYSIQCIAFAVVLFTLLVQAPTNPWLLKKLKLVE